MEDDELRPNNILELADELSLLHLALQQVTQRWGYAARGTKPVKR